ncbi:hypothetical protein FOXYSP1_08880 [Fusarium oxysporum f. sp. phaseoli]
MGERTGPRILCELWSYVLVDGLGWGQERQELSVDG